MCKMASFLHNIKNGDIVVWDLDSHSETQSHYPELKEPLWCEGHYTDDGAVECRTTEKPNGDEELKEKLLQRFPRFVDFFNWAVEQDIKPVTRLSLHSLISADGLVIPQSVIELSLNSLTSADRLVIPHSVTKLYLPSLTSADGLVIPQSVTRLYLPSLQSTDGLVIHQSVKELYLPSLQSTDGLVIPTSVTDLYLHSMSESEKSKIIYKEV